MLGPLEDALADVEEPLTQKQRERQELVHRSGLRLLKLVNSLLDFSRIEAGRVQASYEETDLATLTRDLTSAFRSVVVESALGEGTTFKISIPLGNSHLPAEPLNAGHSNVSTATRAQAFLHEASGWMGHEPLGSFPPPSALESGAAPTAALTAALNDATVLLADDNADMRDYVQRLLAGRYVVRTVADGEAALAAARFSVPDLVLTDVMMPRLDGFGLLRALKHGEAGSPTPSERRPGSWCRFRVTPLSIRGR
ncbi:MAG TPA: response regulator [Polyangiaceae bacterium]|nr:response regulator [Polyangiaceae bacterium]